MAYLVEVPVDGGGRLVVEAGPSLLPSGLELASARPGEIIARARESLEESLDQIRPALSVLADRLRAMAPEEFTVEFGLTFGAEAGLFIAKGTGEVHLNVTMSWKSTARRHVTEYRSARPSNGPAAVPELCARSAGCRCGTSAEPSNERGNSDHT